MQRDASPVSVPPVVPDAIACPRSCADLPSEQLWHDAIRVTREAATAAAQLRQALRASRGPHHKPNHGVQ